MLIKVKNSIEYIHNEVGFNYRMTNLSALGYGQILRMNKILKKEIILNLLKTLK